jgi:hypothetical protein
MGGTSRTIHQNSREYVSVGSELEQACAFKNIVLYFPRSFGPDHIQAMSELTSLANKKTATFFSFHAWQFLAGQIIYHLHAWDFAATLARPPLSINGDLMMVQFNLPSAKMEYVPK